MRYLYVLLVLSLAALLWAVLAIARHIKRHDVRTAVLETEATTLIDPDARVAAAAQEMNGPANGVRDVHRSDL